MGVVAYDLEKLIHKLNKFQNLSLHRIYDKRNRRLNNSINRKREEELSKQKSDITKV
jgi:hypothetical protein